MRVRLLALAVTAAAVSLMLGGGRPAVAAFPGANGKIAFFWAGEIVVMDADGRNAKPVAKGVSPAWSPDGTRIAFDSLRDGNAEIYVMRADGKGQRRLTRTPAADYLAAWAPDGRRLAFTSDRDGDDEVWVVNADGTAQRPLTADPATDAAPAWSPNGARIAFVSNRDGDDELYVMNADGTGVTALTANDAADGWPSWSPDGTRIAFSSRRDGNDEIYVMNGDGSGQTRLTNDPARDERPAWSPDGTRIVFESTRDPRVWDRDVFVMNADGTGVARLRGGTENGRDADWQPAVDLAVSQAASPRRAVVGARLVYRVAVHNRTPAPAAAVVLRDVVPAGARLLSAEASQGRCSRRTPVTCALGVVAGGARVTASVAVRPSRPGLVRNVVVVVAAQADADAGNNRSTLRTRVEARRQAPARPRG